jgi:hypothetical protein
MWYHHDHAKRVGTASHEQDFDEFMDDTHWVRLVRNTATLCSCQSCRNPRRSKWKYKTRQEEKAALSGEEQIDEHIGS